jgi:hypothetical protein
VDGWTVGRRAKEKMKEGKQGGWADGRKEGMKEGRKDGRKQEGTLDRRNSDSSRSEPKLSTPNKGITIQTL